MRGEKNQIFRTPDGGEGVAKSENEYEVVEENNSNLFGGGILRGIRESLLRELRMSSTHVFTNFEYPNFFTKVSLFPLSER